MKPYSHSRKKRNAQSKLRASSKLLNSQLLKKHGLKQCFVSLARLECQQHALSASSSSSQETENKSYAKKKLRNARQFDSEITKNGDANLQYEVSKKHSDRVQLSQTDKKIINLRLNKGKKSSDLNEKIGSTVSEEYNFKNDEGSSCTDTDLAKKKRTRSSSNSGNETQSLVVECFNGKFANHVVAKESKLKEVRKSNRRSSVSNEKTWNLNSECSESVLASHVRKEEVRQKQIRKKGENLADSNSATLNFKSDQSSSQTDTSLVMKRRTRSSSNSSRETWSLDVECSDAKPARHVVAKENELNQRERRKGRSSSVSNREVWDLNSKSMLMSQEQEEEVRQKQTGRKNLADSKSATLNFISDEGSSQTYTDLEMKKRTRSSSNSNRETQSLDVECSDAKPANHVVAKENKLKERGRRNNKNASNANREAWNLNSECSEPMLVRPKQGEKERQKQIGRKQKDIDDLNRATLNMDNDCTEALFTYPGPTEKSKETEIDLSRKKRARSSSNSSTDTPNVDSQYPEQILADHELALKSSKMKTRGKNRKTQNLIPECQETILSRKNRTRNSSNSSSGTHNMDSECSRHSIHELLEENNLAGTNSSRKNRAKSPNRENLNLDSESSESMLPGHNWAVESNLSETGLSRENRTKSSFNSSSGTPNFNSKYSKMLLASRQQTKEDNLIETDLSRTGINTRSFNSSIGSQNSAPICSKEIPIKFEVSEVGQTETKTKQKMRNKNPCISSQETHNLSLRCLETYLTVHEEADKVSQIQTKRTKISKNSSDSFPETQNLDSECSHVKLTSSLHTEGIYGAETKESKTRSSLNSSSSEAFQAFGLANSEALLGSSEQSEAINLTKTDSSEMKRATTPPYSTREAQNVNSQISNDRSGYVEAQPETFDTDFSLMKRARNRSRYSIIPPYIRKYKQQRGYTFESQKNKKNSSLPSKKYTRYSSNLNQNINFHYKPLEKDTNHVQTEKTNLVHQQNLLSRKMYENFSNTSDDAQISHLKLPEEHVIHVQTQEVSLESDVPLEKRTENSSNSSNTVQILHSEPPGEHFTHVQTQAHLESDSPEKKKAENSSNAAQISCTELPNERITCIQTQKIRLESDLPAKKRTKKFLDVYNAFQDSDLKSSGKQDEPGQVQENIHDCNLSMKNRVTNPSHLESPIQISNFLENQKEHILTDENNQMDSTVYLKTKESMSDLGCIVMTSELKFSKQDDTADGLERHINQEESENVIASDSHMSEQIKTCFEMSKKVSSSDIETCSHLNSKCEKINTEHNDQTVFETELEGGIDHSGQEDLPVQHVNSQTGNYAASYLSDESNLPDSEVLKSNDSETNAEVQDDLMIKQKNSDDIVTQNNHVQEDENLEFELSEMNDAEKELKSQKEIVDVLEDLDSETFFQKKYGLKKCSVLLTPTKPFRVHYGWTFLKEVAQYAIKNSRKANVVNWHSLCRRTRLSQFSSLSQKMFERKIMKCIKCLRMREKRLQRRLELIDANETQLIWKNLRRKVPYDEDSFVFFNEENLHENCKALTNGIFPLVLLERNEKVEHLAQKFLQSARMGENQVQDLSCQSYRESDHLEKKENWNDLDHSSYDADSSDSEILSGDSVGIQDEAECFDTEKCKQFPVTRNKNQVSGLLDGKNCAEKQPCSIDSQPDIETETMQNQEGHVNCVNPKPCKDLLRLQNLNKLAEKDSDQTLEPEHQPGFTLESARLNKVVVDRQCTQVPPDCSESMIDENHAISPLTIENDKDSVAFQQVEDSEQTHTTSVVNKFTSGESTSECNPPCHGRETPPSMYLSDDVNDKQSNEAADEDSFVIVEDDDDSEKKSCGSYSSTENHENSPSSSKAPS